MKCEQIHETVIRDIVDLITDVKKSDNIQWIKNRGNSFSSIAKASSDLTLVFPVIVTRSLHIENAAMITKAIERKATSMLQMLFSAIQVSDDGTDAFDYIKKFHSNLKIDNNMNIDQFIDFMDTHGVDESSPIRIADMEMYQAVKEDLRNINYFLPDSIKEASINDSFKLHSESVMLTEAGKRGLSDDGLKKTDMISKINKNTSDFSKAQILDSDVKKANELMPTMMIVNFIGKENDVAVNLNNVVIGVKAKMYVVDSMDVINRIITKNNDSNGLLQLVRASTREISFFRDFLFAIDKAKIDALSNSKKGSSSKIWKVLERRAIKSKVRRGFSHTNDASAITTLVISQEEVEYLKKYENINIDKESIARPIMEVYNLMGLCIVDETQEYAKFLFDTGDDMFETISFNHLERESGDNSTKKIINLMTKMNR